MVATCLGTTLAIASIAAGTEAAGSASAPHAEGSPDLSGQVARSVVKAPTQKRFARHESKKCHERLREDWAAFRAAHRAGFLARKTARRERFDSRQLGRRARFRSKLAQERATLFGRDTTVAEREQSRERLREQQHAFWASQAALRKKFKQRQSARRKAFEAWLRKRRNSFEQRYAGLCEAVGHSRLDEAQLREDQQQEQAEIAMDAQEEQAEADEERQAEADEH